MNKFDANALAKLYGIEIDDVEAGKGGIFYSDDQGNNIQIDDLFEGEEFMSSFESLRLNQCDMYTEYSDITTLMVVAA